MTKHTPTPWTIDKKFNIPSIRNEERIVVALNRLKDEDAKHIVKCVNMHDELVEALENIHKLAIGFDTSKLNINQRNTMALIFQNSINALGKAKEQ